MLIWKILGLRAIGSGILAWHHLLLGSSCERHLLLARCLESRCVGAISVRAAHSCGFIMAACWRRPCRWMAWLHAYGLLVRAIPALWIRIWWWSPWAEWSMRRVTYMLMLRLALSTRTLTRASLFLSFRWSSLSVVLWMHSIGIGWRSTCKMTWRIGTWTILTKTGPRHSHTRCHSVWIRVELVKILWIAESSWVETSSWHWISIHHDVMGIGHIF